MNCRCDKAAQPAFRYSGANSRPRRSANSNPRLQRVQLSGHLDALGIRKASIHYHFPSKTELGIAVVDRYVERFGNALAVIAGETANSSMAMLDHYVAPYLEFSATSDKVCLCGALAGEMMALPTELRTASTVSSGRISRGSPIYSSAARRAVNFISPPPPPRLRGLSSAPSRGVFWSTQTGDASQLRDVVGVIKSQLAGETKNRRH